jgi:hypothetical protein
MAALIGALATVALLSSARSLLVGRAGKTIDLQVHLLSGVGGAREDGIVVQGVADNGLAMVAASIPNLPSKVYPIVEFEITGLQAATGAGLYFTRSEDPTVGHPIPLSLDQVRSGEFRLDTDQRWRGTIASIGIIVQGPIRQEIVVKRVSLVGEPVGFWITAKRLAGNWVAFSSWDFGSSNFYIGAFPEERFLTPVLSVSLWIILTWVFYLFADQQFCGRTDARVDPLLAFVLISIVGWIMLDVKFQLDLLLRHFGAGSNTVIQGESEREKFWGAFSARYPLNDSRVFVLTGDAGSLQAIRASYHLSLFANPGLVSRLPSVGESQKNDFVLDLPGDGLQAEFDVSNGILSLQDSFLNVELIVNDPAIGLLYRIK